MAVPSRRGEASRRGPSAARYGAQVTRAVWPDPLFLDDLVLVLRLASERAARVWLAREQVPTVLVGRRVAVRRAALLAALAAREVHRG